MRRIVLSFAFFILIGLSHAQSEISDSIIMRQGKPVSRVYWSEDGNRVFSVSAGLEGDYVYNWDLEAGTYGATPLSWWRDVGIRTVGWSPDEQHYYLGLDSISHTNPFYFQLALDGYVLADNNNRAAWSPDSRLLATWMDRDRPAEENSQPFRVYDVESRELIASLTHIQGVQEAVWSSDGESILYIAYRYSERAYYDQYFIGRWIPGEAEPIEEIVLPESEGYWVKWIPGDTLHDTVIITEPVAFDTCDAHISQILCYPSVKFAGEDEFVLFTGLNVDYPAYPAAYAELSPTGNYLTAYSVYSGNEEDCGYGCPVLYIWDADTPDAPKSIQVIGEHLLGRRWSPDETRLALWYRDYERCEVHSACSQTLLIANPQGDILQRFPQDHAIRGVQWSADGSQFLLKVAYESDCPENCYNALRWYDARTGEILREIRDDTLGYHEWRQDENRLLLIRDCAIYIYNLADFEHPMILEGGIDCPSGVIWRDNELLSWGDSVIRYWDLTGQTAAYEMGVTQWRIEAHPDEGYTTYFAHHDVISDVQFNADESRLLTWSYEDASLGVWDLSGEQEPLYLDHFPHSILGYDFGASWFDNSRVLVNSRGYYSIWEIDAPFERRNISIEEYQVEILGIPYIVEDTQAEILEIRSLEDGEASIFLEHGGTSYKSIYFLNNNPWVLSYGSDMSKLWDIQDPDNPILLGERDIYVGGYLDAPNLSANEQYLLVRNDDVIEVWELPSLETVYSVQGSLPIGAWDSTGQRFLYNTRTGENCEENSCSYSTWIAYPFEGRPALELSYDRPASPRWLDDGLILTSRGNEAPFTLAFWDAETGVNLRTIEYPNDIGHDWQQGMFVVWFREDDERILHVYEGIYDESPIALTSSTGIKGVRFNQDGSQLIVYGYPSCFDCFAEFRVWDFASLLDRND